MKFTLLSICIILSTQLIQAQKGASWEHEKLWIADEHNSNLILENEQIYSERWNILPQALFWKRIMKLSSDSCLVNVASTRQILESIDSKEWLSLIHI